MYLLYFPTKANIFHSSCSHEWQISFHTEVNNSYTMSRAWTMCHLRNTVGISSYCKHVCTGFTYIYKWCQRAVTIIGRVANCPEHSDPAHSVLPSESEMSTVNLDNLYRIQNTVCCRFHTSTVLNQFHHNAKSDRIECTIWNLISLCVPISRLVQKQRTQYFNTYSGLYCDLRIILQPAMNQEAKLLAFRCAARVIVCYLCMYMEIYSSAHTTCCVFHQMCWPT